MSEVEVWRTIPGWEGVYEASTLGRIRSLAPKWQGSGGKVIAQHVKGVGYLGVVLYRGAEQHNCYAHRLVAAAFIGLCPPGHQVNHRDGSKTNNTPENLEYMLPGANIVHAYETGLHPSGERIYCSKLTVEAVRRIRSEVASGPRGTAARLAREYDIAKTTISKIMRGRRWRHIDAL